MCLDTDNIDWSTDENRKSWEKKIIESLIKPLIDNIDFKLKSIYDLVIKGKGLFWLLTLIIN